jgi:hypothetical protein
MKSGRGACFESFSASCIVNHLTEELPVVTGTWELAPIAIIVNNVRKIFFFIIIILEIKL